MPTIPKNMPSPRLRVLMFDLLPTVPYYTAHLCKSLLRVEGLEVRLASALYPHDRECFDRMGAPRITCLCSLGLGIRPAGLRRLLRLIAMLVNLVILLVYVAVWQPHIVHVQFTPLLERFLPFELWFVRLTKLFGARVVVTVHNVLPHNGVERHKIVYSQLYSMADGLICHDHSARERVTHDLAISNTHIMVIPHGPLFAQHEYTSAAAAQAGLGLPVNLSIVMWQGIIRPYKGVPFLLEAWSHFIRRGGKGLLLIVGSGDADELREISRRVHELGLCDSVRCDFRFVSVTELHLYHAAADILVFPYEAITSSGALLTSMAHGKATIATPLKGFCEILTNEQNSLLAPFGDANAWADAIARLVVNPDLRSHLGDQLRQSCTKHASWNDIAYQTRDMYVGLVTDHSSAPDRVCA